MDQLSTHYSRFHSSCAVILFMIADAFALALAFLLAVFLRFDTAQISQLSKIVAAHQLTLPIALALYLILYAAFHLYRHAWRFASVEMVWGVVAANTFGLLGLLLLVGALDSGHLPYSITIIFWMLSIMFMGGGRICLRVANLSRSHEWGTLWGFLRRDRQATRVVILGGGWEGARLLRALYEEFGGSYQVVGFLDDSPSRQGTFIRGVRVLGPLKHLYAMLARHAVDEVLIAIPGASGADIREYVLACRQRHIPVKVIPGLADVLHGHARARLEEISVEDLLRRPSVQIDMADMGDYLTGKRVLVTGAGGSIGSELCRQILAQDPAVLILLGHGENSIHQIHQELSVRFPSFKGQLRIAIGSVANARRMGHVFKQHQPQVVFHAAAHKHVPIMEDNVAEAVQNNIMGTRCIAEACGVHHVERMVLISTDKAVYPSSVMGATKWMCEEVVRASVDSYQATKYVTVRFGNVLGSRGSVVPIFKAQILRGGPVTVTHPEMTRYFMTIPEAVTLVLQAGAIGNSGELFLLDMGQPVKIVDLARDMIRLSGLDPDKDIRITFTGLRPGEKLHEQLVMDDKHMQPACCERMSVVQRTPTFTRAELQEVVDQLCFLDESGDNQVLLQYLGDIVPGFANRSRFATAAQEQSHEVSVR